jgi:RTX calcium-binding nonapeptide repeat (4 copies)
VGDVESAATALTLTVASNSNPTLVPSNNVVFGGSGANRTLTATAVAGRTGTAVLTVRVSDGQASGSVLVTVRVGSNGNNTLPGDADTDLAFGQNGNDTLSGLGANDLLCGGNGNDTLTGGDSDDTWPVALATTGSPAGRAPIASAAAQAPTRRPTSPPPRATPATARSPSHRAGHATATACSPGEQAPGRPQGGPAPPLCVGAAGASWTSQSAGSLG